MDSFKIYLPSNASSEHYPQNKASDFSINLNNPIRLEGTWEAGIESIYYDSDFANEDETSTIIIGLTIIKYPLINDNYPFKFKVSNNNKWSYAPTYPKEIPSKDSDINEVCKALNTVNEQILVNDKQKIFEFYVSNNVVHLRPSTIGVSVQITPNMARKLGFDYQTKFDGSITHTAFKVSPIKLTKADYAVHVFEENIVKRHERIIIKDYNDDFPSARKLKAIWKGKVESKYRIFLAYKANKVIITNAEKNLAIVFSKSFASYIHHLEPIFTSGEWWAYRPYVNQDPYVARKEVWYIDIHNDDLQETVHITYPRTSYTFNPHTFNTMDSLLTALNTKLNSKIRKDFKDYYKPHLHFTKFSLKDRYIALENGPSTQIYLDKTLQRLLGFENESYPEGLHVGCRLPATVTQQIQRLLVHADFIQPISYGTEKHYIFQDFIHDSYKDYGIIEKRFEPISYIPVARNYIDTIRIQITDDNHYLVHFKDSKTIIIVHFRKVK